MKVRTLNKLLGLTLTIVMISSFLAAIPMVFAATTVYLVPSSVSYTTDTASPGDKFTVTAWVSGVNDLFGFQVALYVNSSVLNVTSAALPVTDSQFAFYGTVYTPLGPMWGNTTNYVVCLIGTTGMAGLTTPFSGTGKLAVFELEIMASPPKYGNVTSDLTISTSLESHPYVGKLKDSNGAAISAVWQDGDFLYEWAYPSEPWLTVDPAYVKYGPYPPNATGEKFTIDIVMNSLSTAWELVSISFNKTYDSTLLAVTDVTEGGFLAGFGATTFVNTTDAGGVLIDCSLDTPYPIVFPYGTGVIATIEFEVIFQGDYGDNRGCRLDLLDIELLDKNGVVIDYDDVQTADGEYEIFGLMTLPAPWMEVESVVVGPEPMQGKFVDVNIHIKNVDPHWYMIGLQFRLSFDKEFLEPVACFEGPFLPTFNNTEFPPHTFTICYPWEPENMWPDHTLFADLLLPDMMAGYTVFPEGEGIIATIRYKILKQYVEPTDIITDLIFEQIKFTDKDANPIPVDWSKVQNGTVTILGWTLEGRVIDLYTQYETPFGGQGPNNPSDMFWPQKEVCLFANVTYNWWPVQQKDVAFEVRDPQGNLWTTLVGRTDGDGVANVCFRIPWPCDDPESLFGVWTVTASVDVACTIINDTLTFHFDYLVRIWDVITDKTLPEYYKHCEYVGITIEYGTHAMQTYPAVFTVVIHDELNVPFAYFDIEMTVGGAEYCTYNNGTIQTELHIIKFAAAGYATIHVNCLNAYPSDGGSAWCPESTATILIYPQWIES